MTKDTRFGSSSQMEPRLKFDDKNELFSLKNTADYFVKKKHLHTSNFQLRLSPAGTAFLTASAKRGENDTVAAPVVSSLASA